MERAAITPVVDADSVDIPLLPPKPRSSQIPVVYPASLTMGGKIRDGDAQETRKAALTLYPAP